MNQHRDRKIDQWNRTESLETEHLCGNMGKLFIPQRSIYQNQLEIFFKIHITSQLCRIIHLQRWCLNTHYQEPLVKYFMINKKMFTIYWSVKSYVCNPTSRDGFTFFLSARCPGKRWPHTQRSLGPSSRLQQENYVCKEPNFIQDTFIQ